MSAIHPGGGRDVSRSGVETPSTTPNTNSPRTMIVNSPKRSTSDSVVDMPRIMTLERPTSADRSAGDGLAMWSRWAPQPALEAAAENLIGHGVDVPT
jgi:hypothetical protein